MTSQFDLTWFYDVIIRNSVFQLGFLIREFQIPFFSKAIINYLLNVNFLLEIVYLYFICYNIFIGITFVALLIFSYKYDVG